MEFSKQFYLLSFLLRLLLFLALPSNNDFELIKNQEYQSITSGLELLDERLCHLWLKLFFVICYKVSRCTYSMLAFDLIKNLVANLRG